jgi:hypothetical protein
MKIQNERGLLVFYLDPASQIKKRVMILHASAVSPVELKVALDVYVKYIWENVNAEEIRVGLGH